MKTYINRSIEVTESTSEYDSSCKRLLSDKGILAWILKNTTEEFSDAPIEEIRNKYIDSDGDISHIPVNPGETNPVIQGGNTESSEINEGTVVFDSIFPVYVPGKKDEGSQKMIVDVEAQKDYYPGYPVQTRGIYYGCRIVSSQYGREFTNFHYQDIKKVYSIWICMDPPKREENTITMYYIGQKDLRGKVKSDRSTYDLINVIVIRLGGKRDENYTGVIKLLDTLLSSEYTAEYKKKVLQEEFGIPMEKEMEEEIENMCNLGLGVLEKGYNKGYSEGISQGISQGINQGRLELLCMLVNNQVLSLSEAAEMAGLSEEDLRNELKK